MNSTFKFNQKTVETYNAMLEFLSDGGSAKDIAEKFEYNIKSAEQCLRKLVMAGYLSSTKVLQENNRQVNIYKTLMPEILDEHIRLYANEFTVGKRAVEINANARFIAERHTTPAPRRHTPVYIGSTFGMV